jgi:uncharacterized protein (TIGR02594 family)
MKKLIFLLAAMLVSVSFVTVAEARPKDKQYHYTKVQKSKKYKVVKVVTEKDSQGQVLQKTVYHDDTVAGYWSWEYNRHKPPITGPVEKTVGDLANKATHYMGATASQLGLPRRLWCADFMNMLVGGTDRRAISYANRGTKAQHGCVNCIAVTTRSGGAHVGVVSGYDEKGNPIIVSGNHNRRVGVATYDKRRVIAYRYI